MKHVKFGLLTLALSALAACGDLGADLESAKQEAANIGRDALAAAGAEINTQNVCVLAGQSEAFCGCLSERLGPEITPERVEALTEAVRISVSGEAGEGPLAGVDAETRQAVVQCATRAAIDGAVGESAN